MFEVTLFVQSGYDRFEVQLEESLTVGREGGGATLIVNDPGLSRRHASFYRNAEAVWVIDENSTNGSFVNGAAVQHPGALLSDGDQISVGNQTTIIVQIRASVRAAPAARQSAAPIIPPLSVAPAAARPQTVAAAMPGAGRAAGLSWRVILLASLIVLLIIGIPATIMISSSVSKSRARQRRAALLRQLAEEEEEEARMAATTETTAAPLADVEDVAEPAEWVREMPAAVTNQPGAEAFLQALLKVKEDRGEPMGFGASVEVPAELKLYSERRRFLAIQTAEALELGLQIPHDFSDLAAMKRAGQFVELKIVTDTYVLYSAGGGVSGDPLTHYDKSAGKSVPLYPTPAELQTALSALPETDERKRFISAYYQNPASRQTLLSEYETLSALARDFDGRPYQLNDPAARAEFKRRLLSMIRPQARAVLEELALSYKRQFNRLLPVASLVRSEEYQRELSERNVNAARNSLPPHTTGLAFDISYRYMTAAEQTFIMTEVARMEAAGRVEALRENNNCFHIFVFPDARPPAEALVRKQIDGGGASPKGGKGTDSADGR